ncbi:FliO/MopB family protein [Paenibacillus abyssi]|nr:flagellar biosynthetic protein FliO [Paenibacillus abyssi]
MDVPPQMKTDDNLLGSLAWVIIALLLIIGMIIVFVKFLSQRSRSFGMNRSIRTLGGVPLGQNKSLQVVEVAGRIYVVGVGEDVTLLDKIIEPEDAEAIIASMEQQSGRGLNVSSVTELIQKLRNRSKSEETDMELWNPPSSFQDILQDKLNRQAQQKQKVEAALKDSKHTDRLMDE